MTADREELAEKWDAAAARVAEVLTAGEDACFLTLGDPLLYSTYIYLLRALRKRLPDLKAVTVPGIMAFGAAAALAEFPVGEGREPVTIVPAADDLTDVRRALAQGGTVVLMKIGKSASRRSSTSSTGRGSWKGASLSPTSTMEDAADRDGPPPPEGGRAGGGLPLHHPRPCGATSFQIRHLLNDKIIPKKTDLKEQGFDSSRKQAYGGFFPTFDEAEKYRGQMDRR